MSHLGRVLVLAVVLWGTVPSLHAQVLETQVLSDDGTTVRIAFNVDWPTPLQAAVDSVGFEAWSAIEIESFSAGLEVVSAQVALDALTRPSVRVVQRDFETVAVREASAVSDGDGTRRADAWMGEPGYARAEPVVHVFARLVQLDASTGVLLRMRRLVVDVIRPQPLGGAEGVAARVAAQRSFGKSIPQSVLSDGSLFRLSVTEPGVFAVDRALIAALGLNPDTIDPAAVRILGNGGAPLPALNAAPRPQDVLEQAAHRTGTGDGRFDAGDSVVFWAKGPRGWTYGANGFEHYVHPFSNENVYFLKIDGSAGPLADTTPFPGLTGATVLDRVPERYVLDVEEQNWSREHGSGHDWMSNTLRSGGSRTFLSGVELPGLVSGSVDFHARVAIQSNPRATVAFESDGQILAQRTAPSATLNGSEFPTAIPTELVFSKPMVAGEPLNLTMRLLEQVNDPQAALDWVRVSYTRSLQARNGVLTFTTPPDVGGPAEFVLTGFAARPLVLDVTAGHATTFHEVMSSGTAWRLQLPASAMASGPREFVAFLPGTAQTLTASLLRNVENQNLRATIGLPDFIIVAPDVFLDAANRLAEHRRAEGLRVAIVTPSTIYNEFSGGVPDVRAMRDLFKFVYDQATAPVDRLKYVLLFGDGHFDYRGLSGFQGALTNHVFPYETEETLNPDASYTSDDYFGLLDDNEGVWRYTGLTGTTFERVDIGIGRLPVQTEAEAQTAVDKILAYDGQASLGTWRSMYTVLADDGPTGLSGQQNDDDLHMANIDQVARLLEDSLFPRINVEKIYAESFERVFLNGFRIPGARQEVLGALERGTLVFNYSGHGGPNGLAQESIFTKEDAGSLSNGNEMSIFITATCSFGWWDLEDTQSGAEVLLANPDGGAVAVFTIVRLAYTSGSQTTLNAGLNRAFNIEMFTMDQVGEPRRLGDILRETKNTGVGLEGNSRKFGLLGDPTIRLGIPRNEVAVERLNGVDLTSATGQMKALDRAIIEGHVRRPDGTIRTDFNGTVALTVFDAEREVPIIRRRFMPTPYYTTREDLIWRGEVEAVAGSFSAEFVVPKDISYSNEPGRISAYATDALQDALGYSQQFLVGGTAANPPDDTEGPEIRLFLNDTTFVDGGSVAPDPTLIVRLYDESGVNTVGSGVGHEMLLVVDADQSGAVDIASAFQADRNSFQRGEVQWPLEDLEPGRHTLQVRAWDVLNNSRTEEISFSIANDEVLSVVDVYNYPNPMNRETRFVFEHNQPTGTPASVDVRIFTLNGRLIRTIPTEEALPEGVLGSGPVQIPWDGRDADFDRPATGVYLYHIRVETQKADGSRQVSEHIEKLAIIR
jgi:hypothetical protein